VYKKSELMLMRHATAVVAETVILKGVPKFDASVRRTPWTKGVETET